MKQGGNMTILKLTNPLNPLPHEAYPEQQETSDMPERIDYKAKTMPYYIYSYFDRSGRQRERVFPQTPYQSDFKAEKFRMRFLWGCDIQGIKPQLVIVGRDDFHKQRYKVNPYVAPTPQNYR